MLRRKLLLILFTLTSLLVVLAVTAIASLEGVFAELDHIKHEANTVVDRANQLNAVVSGLESDLYELQSGQMRHLDGLINAVENLRTLTDEMSGHYVARLPEVAPHFAKLTQQLGKFEADMEALATARDPAMAERHTVNALREAAALRQDITQITILAHQHAQQEQDNLTSRFRWLVVGMALGFLLVINTTILLLLRMVVVILRPVDRLVEATKQLALGRFSHRIELRQKDEFDVLAQAFNHLAQQLQEIEQRKIEVLGQTALTINHELNNALTTIGLQLRLLQRQAGDRQAMAACLRQIHDDLARMAKVVESLKHIRQIVLTDYTQGIKMLDLERSTRPPEVVPPDVAPPDAPPLPEGRSGTDKPVPTPAGPPFPVD
jgi:HAMP domain-containing protein